jgi:hypothetical protein
MSKSGGNIIKKSLVLSLLVIYLFIALVYILYLPQYNLSGRQPSSISSAVHFRKDEGATNSCLQFHRIFKTIITNKDKNLSSIKTLTSVFLLIFSGLTLLNFSKNLKYHALNSRYFPQYTFLNFCSLRI